MNEFSRDVQLRWSDLDPNFHVRHSIYYDWGAFCRIEFLNQYGLTYHVMQELKFGPIIFREECVFRKEIRSGEEIRIDLKIKGARKDYSRWSIVHDISKPDGTLCAVLTVDGAWIDTTKRKLASPPQKVFEVFEEMPRDGNFQWL
jgi:acyl-CoA thioester hydrolase